MKLTERLIQNRLWAAWGRVTGTLLVPNYTPDGWYECDLFYVTAAGFMREYEIKLTVPDFQADFKKGDQVCEWDSSIRRFVQGRTTKHGRLAAGATQGPRQFWYVVPRQLITAVDVPSYAGLLWVETGVSSPMVVKDAPILHSEKVRQPVLIHARGVCYYRMWNERIRNGKRQDVG